MYKQPLIQTLDPSKLRPSDFVDMSGNRHTTTVYTPDSNFIVPAYYPATKESKYRPFPRHTCGFFYYHSPSNLPPTAGELRFRITHTSDPTSFADGQDLQRRSSTPWGISLIRIASLDSLMGLRELLVSEQLVAQTLMEKCYSMISSGDSKSLMGSATSGRGTYLHSLDQSFIIWFGEPHTRLFAVGKGKILNIPMDRWDHFVDSRIPESEGRARRPYQGRRLYL